MTNTFSRPQSQEPVSGAIEGELPLAMKRKTCVSGYVVILSRDKGVTSFRVTKNNGKLTADCLVRSRLDTLEEVKAEADVLKDRLDAEQKIKVAEWVKKAKDITVKQNKDGIAYIGVRSDAAGTEKEIEVLLDDDDWRKFMGATANVWIWNGRPWLKFDGGGTTLLGARIFVQLPEVQTERTLARRARANSWEYAGTRNAGEPRLNFVENLSKYLGMLEQDAAKEELADFFQDRRKDPVLGKRKNTTSSTLEEDSSMTLRWANSAVGGVTAVAPGESTPMKDKIVAKATKEEMRAMNAMGRCLIGEEVVGDRKGMEAPARSSLLLCFRAASMSSLAHSISHSARLSMVMVTAITTDMAIISATTTVTTGATATIAISLNTELMKRADIEPRDYRYKGDKKG
ncbi:hypothetical protein NDA13_002773 [Ustilago tritici]|nr:hypothetical protein NDA13_002773 [Ustilago tritici]